MGASALSSTMNRVYAFPSPAILLSAVARGAPKLAVTAGPRTGPELGGTNKNPRSCPDELRPAFLSDEEDVCVFVVFSGSFEHDPEARPEPPRQSWREPRGRRRCIPSAITAVGPGGARIHRQSPRWRPHAPAHRRSASGQPAPLRARVQARGRRCTA